MAVAPEDTEITLGTSKMLALFFGLVALCAVFFGMGYSLGKNSAASNSSAQAATGASNIRPTAVKAAGPDTALYKAVGQKDSSADPGARSPDGAADVPA